MNAFLLRWLAISIPTLLIVTIIVFGLQQLLPGDPAL
ncbi:MAG: ABC transporter permease, partial [Alphaproteobacteria bacterium]|nr:ABC transporter permease [Alphaproteobacteria bacterium]